MSKYRSFKQTERKLARILNGRRTGHLGAGDVSAGWLVAESKHTQRLADYIKAAVGQARQNAGEHRLGIAVFHEHGSRWESDIVMMSLRDFVDWFGGGDA